MNLPIDIAQQRPLKFKWRQKVSTAVGDRDQECEGALPIGVDAAVAALIARSKSLEEENSKLQAFKDWVHGYLDAKGVPTHIDGPHSKEGCRIGDRLDWLFAELGEAQALNKEMIEEEG